MLKAVNPTTGEAIREVPCWDQSRLHDAAGHAERAFDTWRRSSFGERADLLRRVAAQMKSRCEELAPLMTEEMGKPIREARGEVMKAAWCAEHYAEHGERYLAPVDIDSDAARSYVQHLPLGPILGILPWNAPFWLAFRFCAPALMAGNTCLMKHDPHVPGCARAIADLFEAAGAPTGVFQNVPAMTEDVESLVRHPAVRGVSFTGSTRAGSAVAAVAASEIKPAVLELGGSDPAIVLADADLDKAAEVICLSRMINAGQSCIAAKRIIVEASVYPQMVERLQARLEGLRVGDPKDEATDVGPLARSDLRDNLHRQVEESIAEGARCVLGGQFPEGPGYFYPVTLLADVRNDMTAACEETFGPVAVVLQAEDAEHALSIANDTEYGLGAALWTDGKRGEALSREIVSGQVAVNGIVKTDPRLPSGGVKRSGYGRELGPHGIHEFVNAQQVWIGG
ncbi:NAD-dependent succinate-semialdehyde dehydrogenase [Gilvimarinus sp. F26214L]|uniref:NAD-dependent succinate-semialdehyde dehydrogenase n=1 Tax=Gilvimarinus sp. DZF01 TaxID=3461371 RepID=UPI004045FE81